MNVSQRRFLDLLGSASARFVIPAYQRVYSWTESQCEELWLDVLRAARAERDHFLGTLIHSREGADEAGNERMVVIDGQQRITTVSLLLLALVRYLDATGSKVDGEDAAALRERLLVVTGAKGPVSRLSLSRYDQAAYEAALDGREPEGRASTVFTALGFFESLMADASFDAELLWKGLQRLVVIEVEVENIAAAQVIFEDVNSKGARLNVADMVRNHLLLSEDHAEQARLYEEYWRAIQDMFAPDPGSLRLDGAIKSWLSIRLKGARIRSAEQVYSSFKRYVEDVYGGEKEPILRELRGFSLMWAENYRYHGTKKYKSGSDWAEIGAPALTANYKLKKADDEAYAERVRRELREVDVRW